MQSIDPKEREELSRFITEQMKIFKLIVMHVKDHFDLMLMDDNIRMEDLPDVDKSFYYAFILEISRSIFINWSVKKRRELERLMKHEQ